MKHRLVALGLAAVMVPGLAGCWSGLNAATNQQSASGDGTQVDGTDITIDSATIVAGDPGSGKAAFLGTVFNPTREPDAVTRIVAGGVEAKLTPEAVEVLPLQAASIQTGKDAQADFLGFEAPAGTYVDVVVTFQNAGQATFSALVVPPSGFYAEAAPEGTKPIPENVNEEPAHEAPEGVGAQVEERAPGTEQEQATPTPSPSNP